MFRQGSLSVLFCLTVSPWLAVIYPCAYSEVVHSSLNTIMCVFQMNVYFAFLGQNPQVHAFCKTGKLRKWAVYINNEVLSPTVIILPNNLLEFCVKNCQLLSKYQLQVQPVHENLHLVPDNGNKRGNVAYGLTYLGVSFYRFPCSTGFL